jgi:peptidoglycan/LPS O-acetylase OafA/YrhL
LLLLPQDAAVTGGTGAQVLIVAWSLQYEICFYLLFALAIANRRIGVCIVIALAINMAACLDGRCSFPRSFLSSNLMLLFLLGVLVGYVCRTSTRLVHPGLWAVLAAAAFLGFGAFETMFGQDRISVDRRLIYGLLSAVLILALARWEGSGDLRIENRWIPLMGDASYALYLIHFPLISVLCKLMMAIGLTGWVGAAISYPLILAACVLAAVSFHLLVEAPMLRAFARRKRNEPGLTRMPAVVPRHDP